MRFREVSRAEILIILKTLSRATAKDPELLDGRSLFDGAEVLCDPIAHLVNVSLCSKKIASRWKLSRTIPVHKSSELPEDEPSSFRPISLLPILGKVTEKVVASQMASHLRRNKLFNKNGACLQGAPVHHLGGSRTLGFLPKSH